MFIVICKLKKKLYFDGPALVVSRRPVIAEARVPSLAIQCGACGGQDGAGAVCMFSLSVSLHWCFMLKLSSITDAIESAIDSFLKQYPFHFDCY